MTVDFNQNILPKNSSAAGQIATAEVTNAFLNSVMTAQENVVVPEYAEVVEENIVEEPLPNIMDEIVPKEEIDEQILYAARNLNTTPDKLKKIAEDVLKKNDAFQGRGLYEITRKELTQFITAISDAYKLAVEKGEIVNVENIKQKTDENIKAIRKGVYDSNFREKINAKYNDKNIFEYLEETYPNLSQEEAIQKFVEDNITKVYEERIANGEPKEAVIADLKNELLVIASKINSDEARVQFLNVIKACGADYLTDLCEATLQDINSKEYQIEFGVKATSVDYTKDVKDLDHADHARRIVEIAKPDVAEEIAKSASECYDKHCAENKEALDRIKEKLAKGEELTSEEQELLRIHNLHIDTNAGTTVGINNHDLISKQDKDYLTAQIIKLFEKNGDINEISQKIAEIALSNPEAIDNTTLKELTERLDKLTDGKYSQIAAEVKSNLETQKLISGKKETTQKQEDLGFSNKEKVDTTNLENRKKEIIARTEPDAVPTISRPSRSVLPSYTPSYKEYVTAYGSYKGFFAYAKEVGFVKAIIDAFKTPNKSDKVLLKKAIKRQNTNTQTKIIIDSSASSINSLLDWVEDDNKDAIKKLKGRILSTSIATKALKAKNEEIEKQQA